MSGYVYIPVGLTLTRMSIMWASQALPRIWVLSSRWKLPVMKLCRRLAPDIANMRPAMYSLRISDLRSSSRYSPGVMRSSFGDDMETVCTCNPAQSPCPLGRIGIEQQDGKTIEAPRREKRASASRRASGQGRHPRCGRGGETSDARGARCGIGGSGGPGVL